MFDKQETKWLEANHLTHISKQWNTILCLRLFMFDTYKFECEEKILSMKQINLFRKKYCIDGRNTAYIHVKWVVKYVIYNFNIKNCTGSLNAKTKINILPIFLTNFSLIKNSRLNVKCRLLMTFY